MRRGVEKYTYWPRVPSSKSRSWNMTLFCYSSLLMFSIKVTEYAWPLGSAARNVQIPSWKSSEAPWLHVTRWGAVCVIVWSNEVTFTAVKTNCAIRSHSIRLRMPHSLLCLPYLDLFSLCKILLLFLLIFSIFSILWKRKNVVTVSFFNMSTENLHFYVIIK